MNSVRVIAMLMLLYVGGCAGRFTAKDRFEGMKDSELRIYVRISNDEGYGETDKEVNDKILKVGGERLKFLAAQGIVAQKFAGQVIGSLRYAHCFEEYCEGFIDYKIGSEEKK